MDSNKEEFVYFSVWVDWWEQSTDKIYFLKNDTVKILSEYQN